MQSQHTKETEANCSANMNTGFNWFLIIVVVVVAVLVFLSSVYVIIHFQHPEDKNQAWLPKIVVWLGKGCDAKNTRRRVGCV